VRPLFRYNENGVAYAPWMVNQVDEEAYLAAKEMRKMRKQKEKKDMAVVNDAFLSTDLQADELSGQGLKYKFVRDEVSEFPLPQHNHRPPPPPPRAHSDINAAPLRRNTFPSGRTQLVNGHGSGHSGVQSAEACGAFR
jgi:hypothetical protein